MAVDRPHLKPSRSFFRALPFLAALTVGVAYVVAPPMERAEASWKGTGCVTGKREEAGKRYDGIIRAYTPDLEVVSVRFRDGSTMDFTSPGSIKAEPGDEVRADLFSSVPFEGSLGERLATNRVNDAVSEARIIRQRAMIGVVSGQRPLTTQLDVIKPQGCTSGS